MKIPIPPADQRTPGTKNSVPIKNPPPPPPPPSMVTLTETKESHGDCPLPVIIMFTCGVLAAALIFLFGVTHIL